MPIKSRVQLFLDESGTSQTYIARCTGIPRGVLNYFLCGKRPLPRHWIKTLDQFLSARGY